MEVRQSHLKHDCSSFTIQDMPIKKKVETLDIQNLQSNRTVTLTCILSSVVCLKRSMVSQLPTVSAIRAQREARVAVVTYFKNYDIDKYLSTYYARHVLNVEHEDSFFSQSPSKTGFKNKINTRGRQTVYTVSVL